MRALIAEDDTALAMFLRRGLETEGYSTMVASDGEAAIAACLSEPPDLLILDLNMPDRDGFEVLKALQPVKPAIATLILTGRNAVEDRITCLDLGADDYLQKPFSLQEFLARCRAIQRRRGQVIAAVIVHGDLRLDRIDRTVQRDGIAVELTTKEHAMLDYLLQHRGRVVHRAELLEEIFQLLPAAQTNVVEVYISYLRTKLKVKPNSLPLIETVRGQGYTVRRKPSAPPKRPAQSVGGSSDEEQKAASG